MYDSDQLHRAQLMETVQKHGPNAPEVLAMFRDQQAIDEANLKRLSQLIDMQGWPKSSVVGGKAATAAFLVVQHSDLAAQKRYLPLLREAVADKEAQSDHLALLEDRVLMGEGKKQLYGSQLQGNGKGGWEFYPIEDEANVDQRRKAVGLPPLAEYAQQFGVDYRLVGAQPAVPADGSRATREPRR